MGYRMTRILFHLGEKRLKGYRNISFSEFTFHVVIISIASITIKIISDLFCCAANTFIIDRLGLGLGRLEVIWLRLC